MNLEKTNTENLNKTNYDYIIKTLLIGSSGVGKSSLSSQFSINEFDENTQQTIGLDLSVKCIQYQDKIFKCHLWDTAGHERFKSLTSSYYRGADCVIIVFDLNNYDSFKDLEFWMEEIRNNTTNILCYLVGNKSDLEKKVESIEIEEFIIKHKINNYIEISAKNNININNLFNNILSKIYNLKKEEDNFNNIIEETPIIPPSLLAKNNFFKLSKKEYIKDKHVINKQNKKVEKNNKDKTCCIIS